MAHKHTHEHEPPEPVEQLDAAGKSLSDALRISFAILKVIMIVLVVAFLASGFKTVGPNEQALVLRFGKIQGTGDEAHPRVLEPGFHWILPYPIDEMVKIPVAEQINLPIETFWYKLTQADLIGEGPRPRELIPEKLNPLTEGYALTRSEDAPSARARQTVLTDSEASDYSIVHTRWQVVYQIGDIEKFFANVYVDDVKPGQVYSEVMKQSITPMLQSVVEDAVVDAMVQYTIDQAILSTPTIPRLVRQLVQDKLDAIESGIQVTSVQLKEARWPKQVNEAFDAFITAGQQSGQAISEAHTYADNTLNEAAGSVAEELYRAVMADSLDQEQLDALWSQVAGRAQSTLSEAQTYRNTVVASAEASAKYLQSIRPEYKARPELVAWQIYLDAISQVLSNAEEIFVLQPSTEGKGQEIRVLVNRSSSAGSRPARQTQTTNTSAAPR
ncbi:MAG: protease modulator HflK [Sedimentisphaerales bacterium]|nr:protease modulator HflK [Sedimentisphaerales bacterium]